MSSSLRFLWVYSAGDTWTVAWHERLLKNRRARGFDIRGFCTTIPYLNGLWLPFPELNLRWKMGEKTLMRMYGDLTQQLEDRDVLILYNGANLHPEYVNMLKVMKVYTTGDPENEAILSKPLAPSFHVHLVNQAPSVDVFRDWGLKNVYFWPLGSLTFEEDVKDLDKESIGEIDRRPVTIAFFNERSVFRNDRVDRLVKAFPGALCAGRGWPRGFVDWPQMWTTYRQAQIGWNVHNSTGFNFRAYDLAAHGVMQICDNKSDLAKIYELGNEVVGFDSVEECIELTQFYLEHPRQQREIAIRGWMRWKKDYTPDRIWDRLVEIVERHWVNFSPSVPFNHKQSINVLDKLHSRKDNITFQKAFYRGCFLLKCLDKELRRFLGRIKRCLCDRIHGG